MQAENIRYRSDILNTEVITRDTGKRLGVVKELLVDVDRREVVALGLRDNRLAIAGMSRYMFIDSIRQMGDVILVENEDVIEDIDIEMYSPLIGSEVITETGELLGKVRSFKFNAEDAKVSSLIIDSLGLTLIPSEMMSTYELPVQEIVSSGPNRLIVFEGSEERLSQLTVGILERIGLGKAPWERDDQDTYLPPVVRPENQLGTGLPVKATTNTPLRTSNTVPVNQNTWDEDDWEEPEPQPLAKRKQQEAVMYYEDDEDDEDNWSETSTNKTTNKPPATPKRYEPVYDDDDDDDDAWGDVESPATYQPQKLNIPDKTKSPEYEEK